MLRRWVLPLAVLVAFVVATPASGSRQATPEEAAQIARDLELAPGCWELTVSSVVDPGGAKYARIDGTGSSGCPVGNGFRTATTAGMHDGFWGEWFSDAAEGSTWCEDYEAPPAVGRDLHICNPKLRKTEVIVVDRTLARPTKMGQGAHGYYKRLRWRSWSRTRAVGRGTFDYADHYDRIVAPVTITLSRPRVCEDGTRLFTRQTIKAVRRSDRRRIRFATDVKTPGDCASLKEINESYE